MPYFSMAATISPPVFLDLISIFLFMNPKRVFGDSGADGVFYGLLDAVLRNENYDLHIGRRTPILVPPGKK